MHSTKIPNYHQTATSVVRWHAPRNSILTLWILAIAVCGAVQSPSPAFAAENDESASKAFIDNTSPGWTKLGKDDFVNVNCAQDTWTWKEELHCTGSPVGVIRTKKPLTNFEFLASWRHLTKGNSGIFVWTPEESLKALSKGQLPSGIEVQILDPGFPEKYEKTTGKKADWFTGHGDVFTVGASKMTPFPPVGPEGSRSFPRKQLTKSANEWNHYYVRCINGEIRLWVNGEEVSGGTNCSPSTGYLCLESEGAPIEFRELWLRELP